MPVFPDIIIFRVVVGHFIIRIMGSHCEYLWACLGASLQLHLFSDVGDGCNGFDWLRFWIVVKIFTFCSAVECGWA